MQDNEEVVVPLAKTKYLAMTIVAAILLLISQHNT